VEQTIGVSERVPAPGYSIQFFSGILGLAPGAISPNDLFPGSSPLPVILEQQGKMLPLFGLRLSEEEPQLLLGGSFDVHYTYVPMIAPVRIHSVNLSHFLS
jgi:hypothetical protein